MHNTVPFHTSKLTYVFFVHERYTVETTIEQSSSNPDLNPIKNLWSLVKMNLCEGGKKYNSKADLWEAIKTTMSEIEFVEQKRKLIGNTGQHDFWCQEMMFLS